MVPAWLASGRQEYQARTIRPKIHRLLPRFLTRFPALRVRSMEYSVASTDWERVRDRLGADRSVPPVPGLKPGTDAAMRALKRFLKGGLQVYHREANDPNSNARSRLSAYLHFGQVSAQRVALEVLRAEAPEDAKEAFLEELIVRKELGDNFCFYNPGYASTAGFPQWARRTLAKHARDRREYIYSLESFERGQTHDELWNAAQREMVKTGRMHGYLRMYWAKKILEWTRSPAEAVEIATLLNDRYQLDGRDPNGYTGIAWSIGGVHDRPWGERPIFGSVRYMSYEGCRRKFDVDAYVERVGAAG